MTPVELVQARAAAHRLLPAALQQAIDDRRVLPVDELADLLARRKQIMAKRSWLDAMTFTD